MKTSAALLALALAPPSAPAIAADISLTCNTHNPSGGTETYDYQISDVRVIANGTEVSSDVTISGAAIIYKQNFEIMGKRLDVLTRIDRTSGAWSEERFFPDTLETKVVWTGICAKADVSAQKF